MTLVRREIEAEKKKVDVFAETKRKKKAEVRWFLPSLQSHKNHAKHTHTHTTHTHTFCYRVMRRGNYLQRRVCDVEEFLSSTDHLEVLAQHSQLTISPSRYNS